MPVRRVRRRADPRDDSRALSFLGKMRVRFHGMKTPYTPKSYLCLACSLCVVACPERPIDLVEIAAGGNMTTRR